MAGFSLLPAARLLELAAGDIRSEQAEHDAEVARLKAERDEWRSRVQHWAGPHQRRDDDFPGCVW